MKSLSTVASNVTFLSHKEITTWRWLAFVAFILILLCMCACGRTRAGVPLPETPQKESLVVPTITLPVEPPAADASARLRVWPTNDSTVPPLLAWIVLEFSQPVEKRSLLYLGLHDGDTWALPRFIGADPTPYVTRAVLYGPFADERCSVDEEGVLCPSASYTLMQTAVPPDVAKLPEGLVLPRYTVRAVERAAIEWMSDGEVLVGDRAVRLRRSVSQPCRLHDARANVMGGAPLGLADFSSGDALIENLQPETTYEWSLVCLDMTGSPTAPWPVSFRTLSPQQVRVTEIVLDPLRDWNDSTGAAGEPFDGEPGPSPLATGTDQFVELQNVGSHLVDLSAWSLHFTAKSQRTLLLSDTWARGHAYSSSGGLTLSPGQRFVVRASSGGTAVASSARVTLMNALEEVVDEVAPGEKGIAPATSTSLRDESLSWCATNEVQGQKQGVWVKTKATPSLANACPDR